jgi:hypothetical protein
MRFCSLTHALNASPQGDRHFPEVSSRTRLELLLNFWEARARSAAGGGDQDADLR